MKGTCHLFYHILYLYYGRIFSVPTVSKWSTLRQSTAQWLTVDTDKDGKGKVDHIENPSFILSSVVSSSFHSSPLRSESLHLLSYFFLSVSWAESFCKIHNQKSINPPVVTWMENRNYNFQTVPVITSLVNHLQSYANPMPSSLRSVPHGMGF